MKKGLLGMLTAAAVVMLAVVLAGCAKSGPVLLQDILYQAPTGTAPERAKVIVGVSPFKDVRGGSTSVLALTHIANAGLQNKIHVERRDIEDAEPAGSWKPGLLISNPPYGERLGDEQETAELYKKFGETLKVHFIGWKAAMIISNPELGFRLGIRSQKPITLYNGALECKLLRLNIEESNFFTPKARTQEERIAQATGTSKTEQVETVGAEMFANRLKKNLKKLSNWAKQNHVTCYRAYDADLESIR